MAGTYTVTVKDVNGCTAATTVTIKQVNSTLAATYSAPDISCGATTGSITVTASLGTAPYTYSINGGAFGNSNVFTGLAAGSYNIAVKDAAGCTIIIPVVLRQGNNAPLLVVNDPAPVCSTTAINLTAPSITVGSDPNLAFTYWRDAAATITLPDPGAVAASGTYYIKGTVAGGCFSIAAVNVSINQQPEVTLTGGGDYCLGANVPLTLRLTGTAPWSFTYSDGISERTINNINSPVYTLDVSPSVRTTYTITRVTDRNCSSNLQGISAVVNITTLVPGLRLPTVNAYSNFPVQLQARNLGPQYSYRWTPSTGLSSISANNPVFNYDRNAEYLIIMTSDGGCETVDTLQVKIVNNTDPSATPDLLVPNAWTPNGDGHNDKLFPFTVNIKTLTYFRVFNRWGQLMFETKQLGEGWDGNYKGMKQPIDVYTWIAEGIGTDGTVIRKTGNSALMR